jgi:uncharacterized membrane protein YphA (DoxX/SURF4 family)
MKILIYLSRIIVGVVFIFSGFVKAIDPLGSAYKFHDYFMAFNIGFLDKFSLPLAIILCTAEFLAGFSVLTGLKPKTGILVVSLFMLVFTPLTLVLALTNPVSDCGCFGDAIVLTNWQTFWKNIVILVFTAILFIYRKQVKSSLKAVTEWSILSIAAISLIFFSFYNLKYLPVVDFMPYSIGTKIMDKMIVPEGAPVDEYTTTFIYEKEGVTKEFDLTNYPADDTAWIFIDQKSVLVKKGYQPPIHDFNIIALNGFDLTDKVISENGTSVLMISSTLSEADNEKLSAGFDLGMYCMNNGIDFYVLSASGTTELMSYENGLQFCTVDETTLKTMMRANPGYILIQNGVITGKWSWANLPSNEWIGEKVKQAVVNDFE